MQFDENLINFFKKHNLYDEKTFEYISNHSIMIDYHDPEQRELASCLYAVDEKDKLKEICVMLPYVYDDITMLVSIHELTHAIIEYKNIGKKRSKISIEAGETLPILFEKLYLQENKSKEAIKFSAEKDKERINYKEYEFSLQIVPELLDDYDYNIKKTNRKIKKLIRKKN